MNVRRRIITAVVGVGIVVLLSTGVAVSAAEVWGEATPAVFGAGVQDANPTSEFTAVSCASAGNCTAVGYFLDAAGGIAPMTMSSTGGVWGEAMPAVFGAGVQHPVPFSRFWSVSCASVGNCTAVGYFKTPNNMYEAFTMTSTNGVWADAEPAVFAAGVQSTNPNANLNAVSCAAAGECTAVGGFTNAAGDYETFTMSSTGGVWGQATPSVFAAGVQSANPDDDFASVSCASAGNCTAVGYFLDAAGDYEAFTMTSTNGVWADAEPAVFAAGVQSANPSAGFTSVSCASAGNCTAVGYFLDSSSHSQAFSMTSTGGVWADGEPATFAAGVQNLNPDSRLDSVSCSAVGDCVAVGNFLTPDNYEAFTMTSSGGVWADGEPATFAVGVQDDPPSSSFLSVSCAAVGDCVAVGSFANVAGRYEAFTMSSSGGVWNQAVVAVFAAGVQDVDPNDQFNAVSCAAPGECTAVGFYTDPNGRQQAFTMSSTQDAPAPTTTTTDGGDPVVPEFTG